MNANKVDLLDEFVSVLAGAYPGHASHIARFASEDSGPTLDDYAVYGRPIDTGLHVAGNSVWRFPNGVHICEIAPGSHICHRWVLVDPDPAPAQSLRAAGLQ